MFEVTKWVCLKCKHKWRQKLRAIEPRNCPGCKSQNIIKEGMDKRK